MSKSIKSRDRWYVYDKKTQYGPYPWQKILKIAYDRKLTTSAKVKHENGRYWEPIRYHIPTAHLVDPELEDLIPSKYDGIFIIGVFIFIAGFLGMTLDPIFLLLVIISTIIEIIAISLAIKKTSKSFVGTLGNIFAILWIIVQIGVTLFMLPYIL